MLVTPKSIKQPTWESLKQLGFIDHPDGAHHAQLLLSENFAAFGHINDFKKTGFSNQIHLILEPVSLGLGFTVLPAYAVDAFSKKQLINVHTLNKPVSEVLYVCSHKYKVLAKRMQTVIDESCSYLS
ncbi:LysR family transcriptional regulator [Bermanella sp. WJH001]|uniref:LysR family transcriptional regulator n=1 Tax=Bermanella sp. WJH001 TaxID=3048005 RepID=UPI0032E004E6